MKDIIIIIIIFWKYVAFNRQWKEAVPADLISLCCVFSFVVLMNLTRTLENGMCPMRETCHLCFLMLAHLTRI